MYPLNHPKLPLPGAICKIFLHKELRPIGRPPGRQDAADWVLDPFGATERKNLPILVGDAADAVEQLVAEGLLATQQKHHAPRV